ncbi:class I SAM-dependent methyltransferase [Vibrio sp. Isolate23]|uniref:methyltransferase domain-containing protein n=1 Tax=Vibrio sp. Isolate23 TaxID=2908533 RepID=UPI001EFD18FC|nr:methyltransferase domain-containing protein [Vibrio sp. Isolate23]MCG9681202.1 class I SAM-dependent methyltransferase [Vibrio sp. Isolate23]
MKEKEHIDEILSKHSEFECKNLSSSVSSEEFINTQALFFDKESHWYASEESRPGFTELRLQDIAFSPQKYLEEKHTDALNILDVGTGSGVLIKYIEDAFQNICLHALDLSYNQLRIVQSQYPHVYTHQGDISSFVNPVAFDVIYCNACFGNFLNQTAALKNMSNMLSNHGIIVISHPLGSDFVEHLHLSNKFIVPNTLPTSITEVQELIADTKLIVSDLIDTKDLYICVLKKAVC